MDTRAGLFIAAIVSLTGSPLAQGAEFDAAADSFIEDHCVKCHGPKKQKGDLRLDTLGRDFTIMEDAILWQDALDVINLGDMPPEDEPQPSASSLRAFTKALQSGLREAAEASIDHARIAIRRLSHSALDNTAYDLLGVAMPLASELPKDLEIDGFDNMAATMELSSEFMTRLQQNAQDQAQFALFEGEDIRRTRRYGAADLDVGIHVAIIDGTRATFSNKFPFSFGIWPNDFVAPYPGAYDISIRAFAKDNRFELRPAGSPIELAQLKGNSATKLPKLLEEDALREVVITASRFYDPEMANNQEAVKRGQPRGTPDLADRIVGRLYIGPEEKTYTLSCLLEAGESINLTYVTPKRMTRPYAVIDNGKAMPIGEAMYVRSVDISGPTLDSWPPKAQLILLGRHPKEQARSQIDRQVETFLEKAFRRPVDARTVGLYTALYLEERSDGKAPVEAMRTLMEATLCSPRFLNNYDSGQGDAWAIANRLSYFLWNSMPDDELFRLAKSGAILKPGVVKKQLHRMLKDSKALRFVENFAHQWLGTDKLGEMQPDGQRFPKYDKALEDSMRQETERFFAEALKRNLSIKHFLDSDFTMLNQRLAEHYGIPGVRGDHFRPVSIPEGNPRGGVLSQASVLTVTSNGTRTSPVIRGIWVLENLFGTPPSPPPPDVEPLEPDVRGATTIREMLSKHREIETCAECHRKIDPWGFTLENFDPIGSWRKHYGGKNIRLDSGERIKTPTLPVESATVMPDGSEAHGFESVKQLLLEKSDRFALAFCKKLMSYALGHQCGPRERLAIDEILESHADNGYRLRDLVTAICLSEPFLNLPSENAPSDQASTLATLSE